MAQDLGSLISSSDCFCLNQNPAYPFTNIFVGDETLYLKSDADSMLHLSLKQFIFLIRTL